MSRYLNIFDYEHSKTRIGVIEKENNVTRALLNTLKNSPEYTKYFFKHINIKEIKNPKFFFQTSENEFNAKKFGKQNYLLFICKKNFSEDDIQTQTILPRPDGLVIDENINVVIEAKVNASKNQSQLNLYKEKFFKNKCIEVELYWEDIYEQICYFIKTNKNIGEIEKFILNELKNYLEAINLNTFTGIPFFNTIEANSYEPEQVKYLLKLLRNEYSSGVFKKIKLEPPVNRPMTTTWDKVFLEGKIHDKNCHYTIGISEESFNLELNLISSPRINKVLKKEIYQSFVEEIKKLKDDKNYYLEVLDYRLLKNKNLAVGQNHVQKGKDYKTLIFSIQLQKLKKLPKWEESINSVLKIYVKSGIKNLQIRKQLLYDEEQNQNKFSKKDESLKVIEDTFTELKPLYELFYKKKEYK